MPIYETSLSASTASGKFSEFEAQLPRLQKLGIGMIWFTPVFPRGGNPPGKPKSDSEYCVRDYLDVDPRYGDLKDFRHLVDQIHRHGMKIIMDFVPNHSAWVNPLIRENPEFYKKDASGQIIYPEPWTDVAKFDYSNRDLWKYMADAHKFWIRELGVDGFREDVAGDVPMEFWTWLRPQLESIRPVYLLAEAEGDGFAKAFDADYDWTLQSYLYMIAKGDWPASSLDKIMADERLRYAPGFSRMRHLDNHDMTTMGYAWPNRDHLDPSEYPYLERTSLADKYGPGVKAFAVLTATLPNSQPMIWNGEEIGILDHTPRPIRWQESPMSDFYTRLFQAYRNEPAFRTQSFAKLTTNADQAVYAFTRGKGKKSVVVLLNLSPTAREVDLQAPSGQFQDVFSDDRLDTSKHAPIRLEPWGYRLYVASRR